MTHRTRRRLQTLVLAPATALGAWAVIRLLGIDLLVSGPDGPTRIGAAAVLIVALASALAGWLVVLILDRHGDHPRSWWSFLGSTTLALSMIGPSYRADGAVAVALMTLHVVTAAVVIVGFAASLPASRDVRLHSSGALGGEPAR